MINRKFLVTIIIITLSSVVVILTRVDSDKSFNQEPATQTPGSLTQKITPHTSALSAEELWKRRKELEGKKVTVQGSVKVHWSCTEMPCEGSAEEYCKRCTGELSLELADHSKLELRDQEGNPINCSAKGNNDNQVKDINCPQLEPGNTYRLTGTFNFANEWTYERKHVEIYDLAVLDYKKL